MATLILSDGTRFTGQSFGAACDTDGEVVFNTGMVGYPESMTDPSYRGQILCFTYPLIGNYGVPSEELNAWGFSKNYESENIHPRAIICAQESRDYSHFAAVSSLHEWMVHHKVPGISGIDTRALTKKLREHGVMLGRIVQDDASPISGPISDPNLLDLVAQVSCDTVITYEPVTNSPLRSPPLGHELGAEWEAKGGNQKPETNSPVATIVAFDCGIKRNILRSWLARGVRVHRVPWDYDLASSDLQYDGVFVSNGPGDPKMCKQTIAQMKIAVEKGIPTFGICLGNQLLALAVGGDTYKLKYGHRGANQPCVEMGEGDVWDPVSGFRFQVSHSGLRASGPRTAGSKVHCIITSQNHGFVVDDTKLPAGWRVWFRNANDGTVEGIKHESGKFFSVQFHPESNPGPEDAAYLFDEFLKIIT